MAKKDEPEESVDYTPPNDQQTGEPGVSAAESSAVASGLGNQYPSNYDENDDGSTPPAVDPEEEVA